MMFETAKMVCQWHLEVMSRRCFWRFGVSPPCDQQREIGQWGPGEFWPSPGSNQSSRKIYELRRFAWMNAKYTRNAQSQIHRNDTLVCMSEEYGGVSLEEKNILIAKKEWLGTYIRWCLVFLYVSQHGGRGRWMHSYVAWVAGFACGVATTGAGDGAWQRQSHEKPWQLEIHEKWRFQGLVVWFTAFSQKINSKHMPHRFFEGLDVIHSNSLSFFGPLD